MQLNSHAELFISSKYLHIRHVLDHMSTQINPL